jgi:hypothetical protein
VIAIFKARLTRVLTTSLLTATSGATQVGPEAERANVARAITSEPWMWTVARNVERATSFPLLAGITWSGKCWVVCLQLDAGKLANEFGPEVPYAVVPVGEIFASVYRQCKALVPDVIGDMPRKPRRARS